MKKSLVSTIAAAALIASAGLAAAQQTNKQSNMPGNSNQPSQNLSQNPSPGMANPSAAKPFSSAKQGRSAAVKKHHYAKHAMKKHHGAKHEAMKGTNQGRSAMTKKSQPANKPGSKMSQPSSSY